LYFQVGKSVSLSSSPSLVALQIRNPHNLLQDMAEEAELYSKAGDLVKLLNSWHATGVKKLPDLIVELAQLMTDTGFWEQVICHGCLSL
jgi:hypothetical protein